jgi:3-hydroxyacyl-[acyl-carrier-protein] dehydratase
LRPLRLGAEHIRRLLPHRPPLLLVDGVSRFAEDPPSLVASKHISTSEPVFAGHFPDLWLWPGAYTIEGLAQTCSLLGTLSRIDRGLLEGWQRTAAGFDLSPPPGLAKPRTGGLLAAVDVKLTHPVWAGEQIEYRVARTHSIDSIHRFEVEAFVGQHAVAAGTLSLAWRPAP